MTTSLCPRDEETVAAILDGNLSPSVDAHLETCPSCRAAADLVRIFQVQSDEPESAADAYVPDLIWVRAMANRREQRRHTQRLGLPIGLVAGVLVGVVTSFLIAPANSAFSPRTLEALASHFSLLALPMVMVLLALSLVALANRADRAVPGRSVSSGERFSAPHARRRG